MRAWIALVALGAAIVLLPAAALADATALSVTGSFTGATGGTNINICGSSGHPVCAASPPTQLRWGQPVGTVQSGLGFTPTAVGTIPLNANFVVGTLTHFNFPTVSGTAAAAVALTVTLTATTPDGPVSFTLPFSLGIDETPNATPPPCTYSPVVLDCPDAILLPGGGAQRSGVVNGRTYTLAVLGFAATAGSTVAESILVTQENQENQGFLIARLSRDNTAPAAVDDHAATTSGHSTVVPVLANDSDAENDTLTPSIVAGPSHGTAAVNADGTITYSAASSFKGSDSFTYADGDGFTTSAPATVQITVTDETLPSVTVPGPITAEATGPGGATVTFVSSADDNVDGTLATTCVPPSGSTFAIGPTTVTCTATDGSNNTGTSSFVVTVTDSTPPTLNAIPSDQVVEATGPGGALVTYTPPTATDAVDGHPTVSCVPPSGTTFALGDQLVSCTATDATGNTSAPGTFHVLVQDSTAPALTVPASFQVLTTSTAGTAVSFTATATDAVDASPTVTCVPPSGSVFAPGPTLVTCTATDASHNHVSKSFTVTVVTNRPPVCSSVESSLATLWPPNHQLVLVHLVGATDPDSGDTPTYTISHVTQDETLVGEGSGNFSPDAQRASGGSVYLRSERDGTGNGRVYTIAFQVTDRYGASCSGTTRVTVVHDQAHGAILTPGVSINSFG